MADPTQLPLIDVTPEPLPEPLPSVRDIYLVAAYWPGSGWTIHRRSGAQEHRTREAAEKHANGLAAGWTHRCILHVRLGG